MTKTFVTYRVARAGGTSAGLSILLDDPFGHAPHVRIAALHQAALAWGGEHPGADLQTEVGAIPRGAAGDVKRLHAYLL